MVKDANTPSVWVKIKETWGKPSKEQQIVMVVVIFLVVGIAGSFLNPKPKPQEKKSTSASQTKVVAKKQVTPVPVVVENTNPTYKKIARWTSANGMKGMDHYLVSSKTKPTEAQIEAEMVKLKKAGCGDPKLCEYFIWDAKDGYDNRGDTSGTADKVAAANKEHLAGYLNTGDMFFYYGLSGDGVNNFKIYNGGDGFMTIKQ
jgi:hypothetical protein